MVTVRDLLDSAHTARAAGRTDDAGQLYDQALAGAGAGLAEQVEAALGAASVYVFGAEPGRLPAQLYDVLARTSDDATRARLCAALARCWAYAGQPTRAVQFATQAVGHADHVGDPSLVAECLDSALAAHWGPDELEVRRSLTARLDEVAAHVLDPETRLRAHLWGLQVACELLDLPTIHRQMRALELLGEESARARFFAATRRLMLDLLRGRTDTTDRLIAVATEAAAESALADASLVLQAGRYYSAALAGDTVTCAFGAERAEGFALAEGVTAVLAEAAFLWTCAGDVPRAAALLNTLGGLDDLPRDVNFLLILQCVLDAALAVGDQAVIRNAARLLTPYEGRAVVNSGAVMFHGVTDDTLARAAACLGDPERAGVLRARALATYERIGAQWWRNRLSGWAPPVVVTSQQIHFHPVPGGLWQVGPAPASLAPLRGFAYLRELLLRPRREVAALDLVGAVSGAVVDEPGLGEVLDHRAVQAYRHRLRDLDEELAEAQDWADTGRMEAIRRERHALVDELARATGLGGRMRTTGSSDERARVAVRKAVAAAIDRVDTVDGPTARHLRASIRTGRTCTYTPDPDTLVDWVLR